MQGPFFFGANISLADINMVPMLERMVASLVRDHAPPAVSECMVATGEATGHAPPAVLGYAAVSVPCRHHGDM